MRKECGATGKRAAAGKGWRARLCEQQGTRCTSARNVVLPGGLWLCKERQFRHGLLRRGHGRQAAHPENYFRKTRMAAVPL
jgi:hypothetical protein